MAGTISFVLEVPLCNLRSSIIYPVPCDQIVQKAYYLIKLEERPKVYFPSYLETKISVSKAHILSSFLGSFQRVSLKFGENVA